jgi:CMP-N,N'-diacetyllegionaminic acid synthase
MKSPGENRKVKVLAIIPARGGSKGIPQKNIVDVCGHPLIYYTIREAHASTRIDATIVSTDDEQIADVARELGADVPFMRPQDFATDSARDIGFMQHALEWVEKERDWHPDIMLFLPPTSPSRTAKDIDDAIEFLEKTGADSVRTMVHAPHFNPYKMWIEDGEDGRVEPLFSEARGNIPRQESKNFYMPVAVAYVTRSKFIREGEIWGPDVRMMSFPLERFTDIDTPKDVEEAAHVLEKFNLI